MAKSESNNGCVLSALGMVAGFAAIEGGIVLIAWSLHHILGATDPHPRAMAGAFAGVLLLFAGPQLWFLSSRAWPRVTAGQALAAFPDLALAGWFVLGWAAPQVIGKQAAGMLVGVMVLEFIIIHASIALIGAPRAIAQKAGEGSWWKSERAVFAGLLALYSVGAAGISAAFHTAWLFLGFWLLIANKFIGDWLTPAAQAAQRLQRHMTRWGISAGLYLVLAAGSIFIPVPRLAAISGSSGDGLWEQHPEQAVMMGALYFALLGICELYGGFNKAPAKVAPAAG
ncbi:MAG: hypothetical protein EPO27_12495 [Betaproteobacteria bacterium]|nr:MAG: hypothetical protein EPO27_12495 [Betaproteobacteria bacterium]